MSASSLPRSPQVSTLYPPEDFDNSDATILYKCIKTLFKFTSGAFYSTIEVKGVENVPKVGDATILCFNHGNGLADPKLIIRSTPRMVRFCAKDTLWKLPVMGSLVKGSGAVPVYRTTEHGTDARELNRVMFKSVYDALDQGQMLGFAPEGVSRFLPFMAKPFKTGVARIAYETVSRNISANPNFSVKILPTGITFTHREKFRSDVVVIYGEPIVVDKSWMEGNGQFSSYKQSIIELTKRLEVQMHDLTINCPDWETTQVAMTAARIHRPLGTKIRLSEYVMHLRGWVELLKPRDNEDEAAPKEFSFDGAEYLRKKLLQYQAFLNYKQIKDEHVRCIEYQGPMPRHVIIMRMIQRALMTLVLLGCASPGILVWAPTWYLLKRRERQLLSKGPRWNDSVAEMKMLYGTGSVTLTLLLVPFFTRWYVPLLMPFAFYLTIRFYEDGVASARSFFTLWKLLFLYKSNMDKLRGMRRECKQLISKLAKKLPKTANIADGAAEVITEADVNIPWYSTKWYEWTYTNFLLNLFLRRQKKDWNEVLRLNDHNTMDYVEEDVF